MYYSHVCYQIVPFIIDLEFYLKFRLAVLQYNLTSAVADLLKLQDRDGFFCLLTCLC